MTGTDCTALAGRIRSGCLSVLLIAGAGRDAIDALDSELISGPGGFGKGCKSGEAATDRGGATGGRRREVGGDGVVESGDGEAVILGGR